MVELNVDNMTCGGCARHVTQAVQVIDSKAKVEVDLAAKKVRVESGADPEDIAEAITKGGYPATVV